MKVHGISNAAQHTYLFAEVGIALGTLSDAADDIVE